MIYLSACIVSGFDEARRSLLAYFGGIFCSVCFFRWGRWDRRWGKVRVDSVGGCGC